MNTITIIITKIVIIIVIITILVVINISIFRIRGKEIPGALLSDVKTIGIVVARYKEDLSWLNCREIEELKSEYNVNIYIYNKGDNFGDPNFSKIVNLPNVGVNNHTNLYHVINNYHNLDDVTIFLPGSARHKDKHKATNAVLKHGKNYHSYFTFVTNQRNLNSFKITKYKNRSKENQTSNKLAECTIRPYGKWYEHVTGKKLTNNFVNYMDIFSASKEKIHQYPIEFYEKIISFCQDDKLTETAHYIERLWYDIFH